MAKCMMEGCRIYTLQMIQNQVKQVFATCISLISIENILEDGFTLNLL